MPSKKVSLTTNEFENSNFARKVQVTLECPYCSHSVKTTFDVEVGKNEKRLAITWKCPKCGNYSKIWDWKLHRLEEC